LYSRERHPENLPLECGSQSLRIKHIGNLFYHEFNTEFGPRAFGLDTGANMNVLALSQKPEADLQDPVPFSNTGNLQVLITNSSLAHLL